MIKRIAPNKYWTLELCLKEALKYQTRNEWKNGHKHSYGAAQRHGWSDLCSGHMTAIAHPKHYWTLERCKEEALKYTSRSEWYRGSMSSYGAAKISKWLDECCVHMNEMRKPDNYWTLERCKEDALRYTQKSEWKENSSGYNKAMLMGWLEECCSHMLSPQKPNGYWTLERCKEDALKYKTRQEWKINSTGHGVTYKNGWLEECCQHMKRSNGISYPEQTLLDQIKKIFPKVQKLRILSKDYFQNKPHIQGFDIDIYIPELRKGIEFNGDYWHSDKGLKRSREHWPQEDIDNYHQLKKEFFIAKGIDYMEIWEKDWIVDQESCIKKCLSFLLITNI